MAKTEAVMWFTFGQEMDRLSKRKAIQVSKAELKRSFVEFAAGIEMLMREEPSRLAMYASDVRKNPAHDRRRRFWIPMLSTLTYRVTPWVPR